MTAWSVADANNVRRALSRLVPVLLLLSALAGCTDTDDAPDEETAQQPYPGAPNGTIRFLAIGDMGTGDDAQAAVAATMVEVCQARGCEFVITMGDNIYPDGVRSEYDEQFLTKFEQPYAELALPFYLSLGNHDNGDGSGSDPDVGDHQVAYTFREDRPSDMWNMPARYYHFTKGPADFFALDSGPQEVSHATVWEDGSRGPPMEAWFEEAVGDAQAPWSFAFAHHPYISNGLHGDAGTYDNVAGRGLDYKRFLEEDVCPNVDVFFAGHDHDLQWLTVEPLSGPLAGQTPCADTEFIISGAAAKTRSKGARADDDRARFQQFDTHGFVWVEVTVSGFTAVFYDVAGTELFEYTLQ